MKNIPLLVGTLLFTFGLIAGVVVLFSQPSEARTVSAEILVNATSQFKGPENAKVTIVEFSDLQCPGCRGAQPLVEQVANKYPNDVKVVFRHYPLVTIHQNARRAAEAAEAAAKQNKFWEFESLIFDEQDNWAKLDSKAFDQKLLEYAEKLQIDKTQFQQTIDSQEVRDKVTADIADGNRAKVNATPTFFVNGLEVPAPKLLSTVESLLK